MQRANECEFIVATGDGLADVAFRLCRLMLARKVLWDDEEGLAVEQIAAALDTTAMVIDEVVRALKIEGWVTTDSSGENPVLTPLGVSAILGRQRSAALALDC